MLDAWACSCSACNALCCCFSYHALFELHYKSQSAETTMVKKLVRYTDASVREAERWLNTYLFLDEIPQWDSGRPHCPYLLQRMFTQTENAGHREYDHVRWRGCPQLASEQDASQKTPAVDLVGYKTTQEEIFNLYQEVYQLKRTPGPVPGNPEVAEKICQEILDSLEEHLQCRQGTSYLEETSRHRSRTSAQNEFHTQMKAAYDHLGQL